MKKIIIIDVAGITVFFIIFGVFMRASANSPDVSGIWDCCGAGGAAAQVFIITSGSGSLSGRAELPGGRVFAAITGSASGGKVNIITTYNDFAPGYVAPFVGTVSADGKTMSGTWSSNRNQRGTWTATRRGGGRASPSPEPSALEESAVAKIIQIKAVKQGVTKIEYSRGEGGKWYTAYESMDLQVGDKIRTDENTIAAFEFVIGGRVGVNKNSVIEVVGEGNVKERGKPVVKQIRLKRGGLWAKVGKRTDPLEIQSNGGIMGIRDTSK